MLLRCKKCVSSVSETNNICSLICCAILVISTDEREYVTYSEHRLNSVWLKGPILYVCIFKWHLAFFKEYIRGNNHKSKPYYVE